MFVSPSLEISERTSKRFANQILGMPRIYKKFVGKRGDGSLSEKNFEGGVLYFVGGNSATSLCSTPARLMILDDCDRMPQNLDGEGSPIELALARASTFSNRKVLLNSTPTHAPTSHISKMYLEGDQRKFEVPCPHCEHYQELVLEGLVWEGNDYSTVKYKCKSCNELFSEDAKIHILGRGKWRATAVAKNKYHASFHISSLYAPLGWKTWADIAQKIDKAKHDPNVLQSLTNLEAGLPTEETGEIWDYKIIYEKRERYQRNVIPRGVGILTAGADIQHDRIELEILGHGQNATWSIDYRVIHGDTSQDEVWEELRAVLNEEFLIEGTTNTKKIMRMCVDCSDGNRSQNVFKFVRTHEKQGQVLPIKGTNKNKTPVSIIKIAEKNSSGRFIGRQISVLSCDVNYFKNKIFADLNKTENEKGFCHFPDYDINYFKMLCSEAFLSGVWKKLYARNEALDCRVYALAAAYDLGIHNLNPLKWNELLNKNIVFKKEDKKIIKNQPIVSKNNSDDIFSFFENMK